MVSYCCKTRNFFLTFYVESKKVVGKATSAGWKNYNLLDSNKGTYRNCKNTGPVDRQS